MARRKIGKRCNDCKKQVDKFIYVFPVPGLNAWEGISVCEECAPARRQEQIDAGLLIPLDQATPLDRAVTENSEDDTASEESWAETQIAIATETIDELVSE